MKCSVVRVSMVVLVAASVGGCGRLKESVANLEESALRGCEALAADVSSDGTINQVVTATTRATSACSRTTIVDLANARLQTLHVQSGGAAPGNQAACVGSSLRVDFYLQQGGQFGLVQGGSTLHGQWLNAACQLPEATFTIATNGGTYRVAATISPWPSPVLLATMLSSNTTPPPPDPSSSPVGGPDGPYPQGSPGSSTRDVQATTEQPVPSTDGQGFFGQTCDFSHMLKDDPIVFPNQPGLAHLHTFFGNSLTNAASTVDSLANTGNSTCRGGIANRSAYWVPTLLQNGVPVVPALSNFYYQGGFRIPNVGGLIQHLPDGLRMVAGSGKATGPQNLDYFHWSCLNTYEPYEQQSNLAAMDCPQDDYIQMDVVFPQCWNGHDLDSVDHASHMAYPEDGHCPATHPIVLPAIELHVAYARKGLDLSKLRLSSDNYSTDLPGGYSVHGDWFGGWEPAVKDAFVDGCIKPGLDCHSHLLGNGTEIF